MANSFKPTLNQKAASIIKNEEKQDALHQRYKDIDREVVIVEETPLKTVLKSIGNFIGNVFFIIGFLLAAVGIVAIVFKGPREAMLELYRGLLEEAKIMFGL